MTSIRLQPVSRVDWFRLLVDLKREGLSLATIGALIDVPKSTLHGWKDLGGEPQHHDGERLIGLWCHITLRTRGDLPTDSTRPRQRD